MYRYLPANSIGMSKKKAQISTRVEMQEEQDFRNKIQVQTGMKPFTFMRLFVKAYNRGDIRIVFEAKAGESVISRKIPKI